MTTTTAESFGLISIVIPCYNESECLLGTLKELRTHLDKVSLTRGFDYEIILVDDGSSDDTWKIIETESSQKTRLIGVKLQLNAGQQAAILCGYQQAAGDWVLTLDADLQDPPSVLAEMLDATSSGAEIVIGRRRCRRIDSPFKRCSAGLFYRLMQALGVNAKAMQAGDFRLMSRQTVDALIKRSHAPLFHRFKIFDLGFPIAAVEYERASRLAGETKYSIRKMVQLAIQAAWSSASVRARMAKACLGLQASLVCLITLLAILGLNVDVVTPLVSFQVATIAFYLIPLASSMAARSEGAPCYQIAKRCESESCAKSRSHAVGSL